MIRTVQTKSDKAPKVTVKVCEHSFKAMVDTGATINIIDQDMFAKMKGPELRPNKHSGVRVYRDKTS